MRQRSQKTSTQEQVMLNWAQVWMEEGGSLALVEGESQRLLIQVILFEPLSLFSLALHSHIQAT